MKKGCLLTLAMYGLPMAAYYFLFHFVLGGSGLDSILGIGCGLFTVLGISLMWGTGDVRLLNGRATDLPLDGKRVAICGTLEPIGASLVAPFSRVPCIFYSYNVYHTERSPKGRTVAVPHVTGVALAASAVRWTLGRTKILAFPLMEGFPSAERSDEEWLQNARAYIATTRLEERPGGAAGSAFALAGEIFADDDGTLRRDSRFITDADIAQLHIREDVVPVGEEACLIGHYSAEKGAVVADRMSSTRLIRGSRAAVRRKFFVERIANFVFGAILAGLPALVIWYLFAALHRG